MLTQQTQLQTQLHPTIPNTLEGELFRRRLRSSYLEYCKYVNEGFYMSTFHRYLCETIQKFLETPCTNGVMDILLLSVPPQCGKTFTVTETLPSWFLGNHPTDGVIIASYEGTLAESFSRRNRDKFVRYSPDVFRESPNNNVQGVALWETEKGGRCRAAGLKAGITSYGCELFIIDDPIKNKEAAQSETIIAKLHDEMGPSVQSRIHPGGKLIVIQTRWVENDVIGWIQSHWAEFIWADINIPCECENPETDPLHRRLGESIMGEHLGDVGVPAKIRKDNTWLRSAKRLICAADGEYTWNALYQGHPTAQNGNLFKTDNWLYYDRSTIPLAQFEYLQLSIDATFKQTETSDYVSMQVWGLYRNDMYLLRLVNKRMSFTRTVDKIKSLVKEFPTLDQLVIEDKANGSAIIDTLSYIDNMPPVVGVNPKGGKYSRAQAVSPYVEMRRIHIPDKWEPHEIEDVEQDTRHKLLPHEAFVEQLSHFPYAKHDDMVDAFSQGVARLIKLLTGEEPLPHRKIMRYVKWYPDMWDDFERMSAAEQETFIQTYGAPLEWAETLSI